MLQVGWGISTSGRAGNVGSMCCVSQSSKSPHSRAHWLQQWGAAVIPRTSMRARRLIIMLGLTMWLLWAPVATAFGGCVGMGATCDGPCLVISYALPIVPGIAALHAVEPLQDRSEERRVG